MKKVLYVVDEKHMGGVSVLLEDTLKKINLKKYEIDIMILHNNGDYLDNLPKGVNVIYGSKFFEVVDLSLKEIIISKNIFKILKKAYLVFLMKTGLIKNKIKKERKKCITKKYDVEIGYKDGFCALFTAYGDSPKKYHWLHADYAMFDYTSKYRKLFEKTYLNFDKIIGISKSVVQKFQEKYPNTNCDVIYNLIDEKKIKTMASMKKMKFTDELNFISIGRFHHMKGYDRLINVFNRLNKENKLQNVKLRLVGGGPDEELLKSLVEKYELQDKIELIERQKNPFGYVKASDCFLMCSRYEPFGLVILEAMILGVPVISADVASIREIMDEKYGMITENSEDGLYNALLRIIDNREILLNYKNELKNFSYDTEKIIKKIESLLDE